MRVLLVAFDVDEKEVFPQRGARARRARLDAAHAHAMGGERGEKRVHRAGLVLGRHDERGAVAAARRRIDVAEHQKARGVVGVVLDRSRERVQAVALAGGLAGDRGRARLLRRTLRRLGVRRHRHALDVRQVLREPAVALRERLRVRIDLSDGAQAFLSREEILLHPQLDLAADAKRGGDEQIERAPDHALGRVLGRHHRELRGAGLAAPERLVDRGHRHGVDRRAEMLAHRLLAEGALGPEVGDADRLLQAAAGRDDLAEHRAHLFSGKNAVSPRNPQQNLALSLGAVRGRAGLELADPLRLRRAALDQRGELVVEAVDLPADLVELVRHLREDSVPRGPH